MKRKVGFILSLLLLGTVFLAFPVSAASGVTTFIDVDYHNCSSNNYVRGKAYAHVTHSYLDFVYVTGAFYRGSNSSGTFLESGVASGQSRTEVSVYTKACTYSASNSYYLYGTAREYYVDGTYSELYTSSSTW